MGFRAGVHMEEFELVRDQAHFRLCSSVTVQCVTYSSYVTLIRIYPESQPQFLRFCSPHLVPRVALSRYLLRMVKKRMASVKRRERMPRMLKTDMSETMLMPMKAKSASR